MDVQNLKGKMVGVLGFGVEGRAVTAYLMRHGIKPVIFDQRPWQEWQPAEQKFILSLGINFIFGPDCLKELAGFGIVFRSPGIRLSDVKGKLPPAATITSQAQWFFEHCPAKIIGVTGTKGKGTTSTLIYEILSASAASTPPKRGDPIGFRPVYHVTTHIFLTGNIGATQPLEILDELTADDWVVYELSSFQLQDLDRSPHIAVVLMVTSEHLDYHKDGNEYVEAKSAIAKFQEVGDFAVINKDFENSLKIGELSKGRKFYFSRRTEQADCFATETQIISHAFGYQFPNSTFQLRGPHNLENIMAAILAAKAAGASDGAVSEIIKNFNGLEHRLEFVAEKNGVKFYNDSFSTTPETAIAAIESFSEPEIVILGGSSKNSDFTELGKTIATAKNIKALILIGQEAENIKRAVIVGGDFRGKFLENAGTMAEIFSQIQQEARPGDVVLLSPACASFGMFKNYKDRGEQFKESARQYDMRGVSSISI